MIKLFHKNKEIQEKERNNRDQFVQALGFHHVPFGGFNICSGRDQWEVIKANLAKIDWVAWRNCLESRGFTVYQDFCMDTFPYLSASQRGDGFGISVGVLDLGDHWQVSASIAVKDILNEIHGFKFVFDHGYSGRPIAGGGAWFESESEIQKPVPFSPPTEALDKLIEEQRKKAQELVQLFRGII